jgi:hypothetical protein
VVALLTKMVGCTKKIRLVGLLRVDIMALQEGRNNMKVKPKEVLLNLPVALMFNDSGEIASFAANINTILHGKVRLKFEELGKLGDQFVGLFYLDRNGEYFEIRNEFVQMIEREEIVNYNTAHNYPIPELDSDPDEPKEE